MTDADQSSTRPGRPKDEAKGAAILEAAGQLFLERGFQGTSMDAVAQVAGVSKQTVYSHYRDKDDLFQAVIDNKKDSHGFGTALPPIDGDVRTLLLGLAGRLIALLFDPEVVRMYRVVLAETGRSQVPELFFESGPRRTVELVATFLGRLNGQGLVRIPAPRLRYAAVQLINMVFGEYLMQALMGVRESIPAEERDAHLAQVVDDFLKLYGIR